MNTPQSLEQSTPHGSEPSDVDLPPAPSRADGMDLLRLRIVRALILWRGFPYVFQAALLAVFVTLAVMSWGIYAPDGVNAKLFAKTNLATLLIWGVWWPAMVWIAVLLGRAWCMVCPLELVSNVGERLARRLGLGQRPLRRWMAAGGLIFVLYALIQMFVLGVNINRVPAYTSWFLIGLLGLALLTALVFKDRAFCRGFCPVGVLLGTYGRGGMLAVRAGLGKCAPCTGRDCIISCNRTRLDARSCPSLLNPPKLNSNKDCLVCGQCIKSCAPDNMQLLLRKPFCASDAREPAASWPVTLFLMLVSGFVLWELFTEWPAAEKVFLAIPVGAAAKVGWPGGTGWFEGVWILGMVPLALWSAIAAVWRLLGNPERVTEIWRRMTLPLAVVIAAGHMSKGLAKFVSWAPFLPQALRDPHGLDAARAVAAKTVAAPAPLLGITAVAAVCLGLMSLALIYALREYRLAHPGEPAHWRRLVPIPVLAVMFSLIIAGWMWR
jgi:polyferredoxin